MARSTQNTNGALFKLDTTGKLVYSTYLPFDVFYSRHNLAVDATGNAYVVGTYPWVTVDEKLMRDQVGFVKLDPSGTQLLLEAQIGGTGTDRGVAIALDGRQRLSGGGDFRRRRISCNCRCPSGACGDLLYGAASYCYEDAVVVVLNAAGKVTYASYHGGSFTDTPNAIGTDGKGNIMVVGNTASSRFPFVNAIQDSCVIASYSEDCESGRALCQCDPFA